MDICLQTSQVCEWLFEHYNVLEIEFGGAKLANCG
jgi:hypothetical protein